MFLITAEFEDNHEKIITFTSALEPKKGMVYKIDGEDCVITKICIEIIKSPEDFTALSHYEKFKIKIKKIKKFG